MGDVLLMSMNNENEKSKKCRIWWPEQLWELKPCSSSSSFLLFGWFFNGGDSVDLVVASLILFDNFVVFTSQFDDLQETFNSINEKIPNRLKEKALFTLIGHCTFLPQKHLNGQINNGISETQRGIFVKSTLWAEFGLYESKIAHFGKKEKRFVLPAVQNLHLDPDLFENCDCHVIVYDCPIQGKNHYSLRNWGISQETGTNLKKPKWITDLENKPSFFVSKSVILALNCSNFAKSCIEKRVGVAKPAIRTLFVSISDVVWNCVAFCVASTSTILYIFLQLFQKLLTSNSKKGIFLLKSIFPHSCKNIEIRASQFLYWPVFLQGTDYFSSNSNVEFKHKSALKKHSIWSIIIADITLGFLFSIILLKNKNQISHQILTASHQFTETILRSGCVWLMGVPAGFKLNTEMARILGMVSLNAVQLYSTIWYIIGRSVLGIVIVGVAVMGVLFGLTLPLSFFVDLVKIGSFHVACLHWLVSVVYSKQIQALASLWRIFRGIKWNPLRRRIDSYNYTVEQHIVGSLIFTPLLLLLPTTSVFYVFFTILNAQITLMCFFLEILISVLYATPFCDILFWVFNKKRFASGIWFDNDKEILVSLLRTNYATLGQVIGPYYKKVFCTVPSSFGRALAYGLLSGQRMPSNLNTNLPSSMPWMDIRLGEYWELCYGSVIASRYVQKREIKGAN